MIFDYTRPRATAERLIDRFGQTVTLIKPGAPTGPEWAPEPGRPTEHAIRAVEENQLRRDQGGTLIGEAVHALIVSTAAGVEPRQADRVRIGAKEYEITDVRPLSPGGVTLLYQVTIGG